jgi:hypothetical protein
VGRNSTLEHHAAGGMPWTARAGGNSIGQQRRERDVVWPAGYYQLFEKRTVADSNWQPWAGFADHQAILSSSHLGSIFRVSGPRSAISRRRGLPGMPRGTHATVMKNHPCGRLHQPAVRDSRRPENNSCLSCHTSDHGLPRGLPSRIGTGFSLTQPISPVCNAKTAMARRPTRG